LAPAAPSEQRKISRVGAIASATVNAAESSAPVTKPHCTAIVSHATASAESCHSARTCGITAVAENHVDWSSSAVAVNTTRVARGVRQATAQKARRARKAATDLRFWQALKQYRRRGPLCTSAYTRSQPTARQRPSRSARCSQTILYRMMVNPSACR
jgi:hypothetical protein